MIWTNVLIIEDDEWLAKQYQKILRRSGYDVEITTNVIEAIELVDDVKPDVIVSDFLLSGPTIMPLLHELQTYLDTAKIPVIICSVLADSLDINNLKAYGVKKILDKTTMSPSELVDSILEVEGCE